MRLAGKPPKILLEGRPGVGKTTVARRTVTLLRAAGVPLSGFVTEEIRERGRRVGFSVESLGGERGILAHVDFSGPPRVSKYGVDLPALERIVLPALKAPAAPGVVVMDELGKMELFSVPFRDAVSALFDSRAAVLATIHVYHHPFTDSIKRRADVETIRVGERSRDALPDVLAGRLTAFVRGFGVSEAG